ncbi:AAA family ATPase [Sphingomonas sp. UNC305MFCol5.2]|uniref:AAA family ATPase n=1 Tax=Sphingomonas sp. UNC305MFCol5.2 TaxID=1449076 RepID=UPI00055E7AFF|nr:AAA family ATPase [Sphingomonas sp. UNC305MFCol5.2]
MADYDDLPRGIHVRRALPDNRLGEYWDAIVVPEHVRERLLAHAVLNYTVRPRVSRAELPLHGVILMTGAPGTGKTSLARGLAHRVALAFPRQRFTLLEVEPHSLTSSGMGKTQRAVTDLFSKTIAEAAATGPTIVLLDEVETLAADRSRMSLEANPIDIHRATDAVLIQLDALAERYPHLLFVATSNFPEALDSAFTSRCDLVMTVPLPDAPARLEILKRCLRALGAAYPAIGGLADELGLATCAAAGNGLDARAIRKAVANALASNRAVALDPASVTIADLILALRQSVSERTARTGVA